MIFSSMVFLCAFLPVVLIGYYLVPAALRNPFLLVASLFFYGWGEPKYILIMIFSTVFDYTNGRLLEHYKGHRKARRRILLVSVAGNLFILSFFKYTDFILNTLKQISGSDIGLLNLALPIGISFYTFQTMSYTIDVYMERVEVQKNLIDFATYVCLFPQLIAGPIVRYADVEKEISHRKVSLNLFTHGMERFIIGLAKKVVLANQAGALWSDISDGSSLTMVTAWVMAIAYTFQIYFDFSGYSDMAIGLGEMFGFHFPENFAHPYEAKSITEFWRRWHMTLGSWFREYVYIPLGGNRKGLKRQIINLIIVWSLTGIWHGAGWNFLIWGLYYGLLLILEKVFLLRRMESLHNVWKHLYTLFFVNLGWVFFTEMDLTSRLSQLRAMAGMGASIAGGNSFYLLRTHGLLLILLAIASTSYPGKCMKKLENLAGKNAGTCIQMAGCIFLLILSYMFLVGDSYNPFLYFRF